MKISKKTVVTLCIIITIITILSYVLIVVLWINQKPNFSKYHSYVVVLGYDKDLGNRYVQLTDKQFQQIVDVYKNDKTLNYEFEGFSGGERMYDIRLYKTSDMTGKFDIMVTCDDNSNFLKIERINEFLLCIFGSYWYIEQDTARQVNAIIEEAIEQSESE